MGKQLVMPILENNGALLEKIEKLKEEQNELYESYCVNKLYNTHDTKEHLVSEAYDCLQVALGIILQAEKELRIDLVKGNDKHVAKLVNRQVWTIKEKMFQILDYR
ncbi:MAG TPA: hypothetical protein GX707_13945, partial [Epulopiscium sp.]|nr:hypothetical protein [Candidatus Epulonipiscium sp.]